MRISDVIADFINELLEDDDYAVIQRNDLAEHFNCVPSQINYVISTRFTPTQGYYVESSRGTHSDYLMHIINSIGNSITAKELEIFVNNFLDYNIINEKEAKLIKAATSDKALTLPKETKDEIRAKIFKNMLINLV